MTARNDSLDGSEVPFAPSGDSRGGSSFVFAEYVVRYGENTLIKITDAVTFRSAVVVLLNEGAR